MSSYAWNTSKRICIHAYTHVYIHIHRDLCALITQDGSVHEGDYQSNRYIYIYIHI